MAGPRLIGGAQPLTSEEARRLSPLALAYVGDAVYEICIRERTARKAAPMRDAHGESVKWVSAEGQEIVWAHVKPNLLPDEEDVARRGRNVKSQPPRHASPAAYRRSTALEAVLGYLYLTGRFERVAELLLPALDAAAPAIEGGRGTDRSMNEEDGA